MKNLQLTTNEKNLLWFGEEEMKNTKEIVFNEKEKKFIEPYFTYFEFCEKQRHIVNTVNSYIAFEEECEQWQKIAINLILEDRAKFND